MSFTVKDTPTSLHYVVKHPKTENNNTPLIILLHGVGSNEKDLFAFANQLPENYLVVSARAPYVQGEDSYAWYNLHFSEGKPIYDKKQAEESRKSILKFIEELKQKFTFDHQQIYLCGFSQGAIMAYSVGLSNPDKVKGVAIMSGRLLEDVKPMINKEKVKSLKVFISHGIEDPVLGIHYAREANQYLKTVGIAPTYYEYMEVHTINQMMLKNLIEWLNN
jgi:phospholipase/carboxylesterase